MDQTPTAKCEGQRRLTTTCKATIEIRNIVCRSPERDGVLRGALRSADVKNHDRRCACLRKLSANLGVDTELSQGIARRTEVNGHLRGRREWMPAKNRARPKIGRGVPLIKRPPWFGRQLRCGRVQFEFEELLDWTERRANESGKEAKQRPIPDVTNPRSLPTQ